MRKVIYYTLLIIFVAVSFVYALDKYEIEVSHNDELFIINGEKFEAKTYCLDIEEGDEVIFLEGSPFGACVDAVFLNLRTKKRCEVWCE